jgi:hypothetical protein
MSETQAEDSWLGSSSSSDEGGSETQQQQQQLDASFAGTCTGRQQTAGDRLSSAPYQAAAAAAAGSQGRVQEPQGYFGSNCLTTRTSLHRYSSAILVCSALISSAALQCALSAATSSLSGICCA